ncbi:PREDICTED: histone H1B-like [Trachymyrmex cornetzi]|uniref:Histone H1.3 n=1 Tax=Trachymyrmex cornetzi TaxID=471704 RepID=A0A195D965_9HYME|nr:PREDICTED: histone H1B-like [Trachymyrmex cornetzi]KYN08949.1 Histone H1.3 [Trachymyrmex cornetzi]
MEDKNASGNAAATENSAAATPAKKSAKSKAKTQRPKSNHPPTSEMVTSAIKELKDRKGSSVQAIKKYIASTYKVDGEKFAPFIKRYLRAAVTSGAVVQTKGKGASGSFKLSTTKPSPKGKVKRVAQKPISDTKKTTEKKVAKKAPAAKKVAETKKTTAEKKPAPKKTAKTAATKKVEAAAKQKAAAQTKNLSKTKKATKAPAAKTKTPKPKTTKAAATKSGKAAKK